MIPELFHVGPLSISPFGPAMALAFVGAYVLIRSGFARRRIGDVEDASAVILAAMVGGVIGAKLYYAVLYRDWSSLLDRHGLVWYGGFALGAVAVIWTLKRRQLPLWSASDVIAPALALGYGVGRIGCFLVGDDFGMPTDLPWGVKFPYGLPGATTAGLMRRLYGADIPWDVPNEVLVAVHPTQLYESSIALLICGLGLGLNRRSWPAGVSALVVIGLLASERFMVEFVRAKDDRMLGVLTVAQVISLVVVLTVVVVALWRTKSGRAEMSREVG